MLGLADVESVKYVCDMIRVARGVCDDLYGDNVIRKDYAGEASIEAQEPTMSLQQITPEEAYATMEKDQTIIYLDVRTVPEFEAGHPPSARNVPVVLPNPAVRRMVPNPDFLPTVEANVPKDAKIIVGCMSGGRSQYAAELLEAAGYERIANMQGGFGGARDPMGRVITPGWQDYGLPEESGDGGPASYDVLLKKQAGQ
jgi:rhodanese-related sulfurtransferase